MVYSLGFGVQGVGCRVQGSGFWFLVSGFRVQGSGFRAEVSGFRFQGAGFRVQGSGFRGRGYRRLRGLDEVAGSRRLREHQRERALHPVHRRLLLVSGFRTWGVGFSVIVKGLGFRALGLRF